MNTSSGAALDEEDASSKPSSSLAAEAAALSSSSSSSSFLREFAKRLYCPDPQVSKVASTSTPQENLSYIPWQLQFQFDNNGSSDTNNMSSSTTEAGVSAAATTTSFLPYSYLDLRRQQNVAFADQKCRQAISAQRRRLDHPTEAACSLFRQALELVPDHVDALLGLGKLLFQSGQLAEARRAFEDILDHVDSEHEVALRYLHSVNQTILQRQPQQPPKTPALFSSKQGKGLLTTRDSSAFQDALLERNLALEDEDNHNNNSDAINGNGHKKENTGDESDDDEDGDSSTDDDGDESSYSRDRRRRRTKRKWRKKEKKRKKRRKRKKKDKKRKRRRRSYSSNDNSSDEGSDEDEDDDGSKSYKPSSPSIIPPKNST